MKIKLHSYAAYSISCFIVWAVLIVAGLMTHRQVKDHAAAYVFVGWLIGWLSATIARRVYR